MQPKYKKKSKKNQDKKYKIFQMHIKGIREEKLNLPM